MLDQRTLRRRPVLVALLVASALLIAVGVVTGGPHGGEPATAAEPSAEPAGDPAGDPWIVSLGDSYISGEAGRWAGNTDDSSSLTDALGPTAYYDNPTDTGELIAGCHRSKSAEVHIGGGINSLNLACSGAETMTKWEGSTFKPGLDFYDDGNGNKGQALLLEEFASANRVDHIAISIGGNNFMFETIVETCVEDYLESRPIDDFYCSQDPTVLDYVSPEAADKVRADIVTGFENVQQAMSTAGYEPDEYSVSVQNYVTPLPYGNQFRYPQDEDRFLDGGCGLWDVDVNWALNEAMRTVSTTTFEAAEQAGFANLQLLDVSDLTVGKQLCGQDVRLIPDGMISSWSFPGAVDVSEWINQIHTADTIVGPYELQESLHPNYWAQLALRGCLRQVYNDGNPQSGTCVRAGDGLNPDGEPPVRLNAGFVPLIPTAVADSYSTGPGTTLVVASPGVLGNDTVAGTDVLTSQLVTSVADGQVTLLSDGSFTYVPAAGFAGTDSFTYRASTRSGTSQPVTVSITVAAGTAAVTATPTYTG